LLRLDPTDDGPETIIDRQQAERWRIQLHKLIIKTKLDSEAFKANLTEFTRLCSTFLSERELHNVAAQWTSLATGDALLFKDRDLSKVWCLDVRQSISHHPHFIGTAPCQTPTGRFLVTNSPGGKVRLLSCTEHLALNGLGSDELDFFDINVSSRFSSLLVRTCNATSCNSNCIASILLAVMANCRLLDVK
jgi:hypothetical protein